MGASREDLALIPSVSAAAGLVAAQLGQAAGAESVVICEREYSSNHFPWRQLVSRIHIYAGIHEMPA
jgi:cysteine desulfurase/selenocysteine lyase